MENVGKEVCKHLHHNVGGTLIELDGGKCKVETDEVEITVLPDGAAKINPKKAPEIKIAKKYAEELRRVYRELGLI